MRSTILFLCLPLVAGCSAEAPRQDGLASRDVPCLRHQIDDLGTGFRDAVSVCGVEKPDLTGNGGLQQAALDAKVPFTIRPHADATLKQARTETVTGDLIPSPATGSGSAPQDGAFRSTMPLSDGQ